MSDVGNRPEKVVLDASLALNILLGTVGNPALTYWAEWQETNAALYAPELLFFELSNILRKQELRNGLVPSEIDMAVRLLLKTPIQLHSALPDLERAIQIARQRGLAKTYDMFFVALAERLGATLGTSDEPLRDIALALGIPVIFVEPTL